MTPATVLWEWNVKAQPFEGQVEAAAAGGFDILSVPYRKYQEATDMTARADASGVRLDFLDGASCWTSVRYPEGADDFLRAALDFSVDDALAMCEALGLTRIVAIAGFVPEQIPAGQLIEDFGSFCERAAAAGLWVDLEPMPMLGLPTLASAWEIVEAAGAENSGVMLDTWHFARGGPDLDLLRSIPRERLVNVQLVDGYREPRGADLWEDSMTARLLPGEGELPLVETLQAFAEGHTLETVGPEAIADELDTLAPRELGERAQRATTQVLAEAGLA